MKLFVCALFLALPFLVMCGKSSVERSDANKAHPGYCYSKNKEIGAMDRGEVKTKISECVQAECKEGGHIRYKRCKPILEIPENCIVKVNLNKPYPHCCLRVEC